MENGKIGEGKGKGEAKGKEKDISERRSIAFPFHLRKLYVEHVIVRLFMCIPDACVCVCVSLTLMAAENAAAAAGATA